MRSSYGVFPACAGMSPAIFRLSGRTIRFPRMRGDEPQTRETYASGGRFSPYARGYIPWPPRVLSLRQVFLAHAGLQINVVALLLAAHIISAQFHGAHTSQARPSFPDRSLLRSTLSG